jgi:hypothetical protein
MFSLQNKGNPAELLIVILWYATYSTITNITLPLYVSSYFREAFLCSTEVQYQYLSFFCLSVFNTITPLDETACTLRKCTV